MPVIKVASYNIHKGVGTDGRHAPERIVATLAEIDADVVMLQEADQRFGARAGVLPVGLIAEATRLRPVGLGHNPRSLGWHGNAALVSSRVEVTAALRIDLPRIEPRGAILIEVRVDGQALRIGGMHLDLTGLRRRQQARWIMAQVGLRPATMPTVLMGDCNEWRDTGGCLADFARDYRIAATGRSFPARLPLARLDRIMVSGDLVIESSGAHVSALSRVASDHLPVWASLSAHSAG